MKTPNPPINALTEILNQCDDSLNQLYRAIDEDSDEPQMPSDAPELIAQLLLEIRAAAAVALTLSDTSRGWPADSPQAMISTGPRSGYPADLVSGLLSLAEAMVAVINYGVASSVSDNQFSNDNINGALWGVHTYLLQVVAIISCEPADNESQVKAA